MIKAFSWAITAASPKNHSFDSFHLNFSDFSKYISLANINRLIFRENTRHGKWVCWRWRLFIFLSLVFIFSFRRIFDWKKKRSYECWTQRSLLNFIPRNEKNAWEKPSLSTWYFVSSESAMIFFLLLFAFINHPIQKKIYISITKRLVDHSVKQFDNCFTHQFFFKSCQQNRITKNYTTQFK